MGRIIGNYQRMGEQRKGRDYKQYLVGEHDQVSYSNTMITFYSYVYQVLTIIQMI